MTAKQWRFIRGLCREHHIPLGGLARALGVESLEDLNIEQASAVIDRLLDERECAALKDEVLRQGMNPLFKEV